MVPGERDAFPVTGMDLRWNGEGWDRESDDDADDEETRKRTRRRSQSSASRTARAYSNDLESVERRRAKVVTK